MLTFPHHHISTGRQSACTWGIASSYLKIIELSFQWCCHGFAAQAKKDHKNGPGLIHFTNKLKMHPLVHTPCRFKMSVDDEWIKVFGSHRNCFFCGGTIFSIGWNSSFAQQCDQLSNKWTWLLVPKAPVGPENLRFCFEVSFHFALDISSLKVQEQTCTKRNPSFSTAHFRIGQHKTYDMFVFPSQLGLFQNGRCPKIPFPNWKFLSNSRILSWAWPCPGPGSKLCWTMLKTESTWRVRSRILGWLDCRINHGVT